MNKLHNNDNNLSRAKKHSDSETSPFTFWKPWLNKQSFLKLFKREKPELVDMTFDSKRKQGLKINKKKILLFIALGIMVVSGIGASIIPIIRHFNAPAPKQEVENKTINDVLTSTNQQQSTIDTSSTTTTDATTTTTTGTQDAVDKKIQEEVEKERAKLAEEYSKKLEDATKSVQDANSELAKAKSDKDALQKQVDELKTKLEQSSQSSQSGQSDSNTGNRVEIPQN